MLNYSVIDLLKDYQLNKSKIKLLDYKGKLNDETIAELENLKDIIEKLDYCISCLSEQEKEVLTNIYVKRISMRKISKVMIMSRTALIYQRDKAVKMLEKLFETCKITKVS